MAAITRWVPTSAVRGSRPANRLLVAALVVLIAGCGGAEPAPRTSSAEPIAAPTPRTTSAEPGAWNELAPLPIAAADPAFVATETLAYAAGGVVDGDLSDAAWSYDRANDVWTELPPMPTARQRAAAVIGADGRLYVIGGSDLNTLQISVMEVYDPTDGTWTTAESFSSWAPGAIVDDGGIIVAGDAQVRRYDIGTDTWTDVGSYVEDILGVINIVRHGPSDRLIPYGAGRFRWLDEAVADGGILVQSPEMHDFAGLAAGPDGRLYEIGGQPLGGGDGLADVNVFDPRTATWATGMPLPEPISFVRAVGLSNSILILGPTTDG